MESLDLLFRGVAMQSSSTSGVVPGGGLGGFSAGRSVMSFQSFELVWVVAVATIVLAVMSVTRGVSVMTWGWSKSGSHHVRVRVQSFASLAMEDGAIVTAGGMFSAEIVHHSSADSCSEDASSPDEGVSERAEMLFIFDENGASLMATTSKHSTPRFPPPLKVTRPVVVPELLLLEPVPTPGSVAPRREGIHWNVNVDSLCARAPTVTPVAAPLALPSRVVSRSPRFEFDPLLNLRIRDAVVTNGSSLRYQSLPTPVRIQSSAGVVTTLKNDVVRVWDSDARTVTKSVHLGNNRGAVATAFDVDWESQVAAIARNSGALSIANLDTGAYTQCYRTEQPIVHAIHLSSPSLLFTGASSNPGSAVSLYDCRSSSRSSELAVMLPTAVTIYNIQSRGCNEVLIQDESNSIASHDLRLLRSSPLSRKATDGVVSSQESIWWNMETVESSSEEDDDDVDEDDFFDCLPSSPGASFNMSRSFVKAVSFNFSSSTKA